MSSRLARWSAAIVVAALALTQGQGAGYAQSTLQLLACKKLLVRRGVSPGMSDSLIPQECGSRFTTQDPYVALIITFRFLSDTMDVGIQLLDPSESALWATRTEIRVQPDTVYESYWIYAVLPVAADLRALAEENLQLALGALRFPGRPARERLGEWVLRVSVNRGTPNTLRFRLDRKSVV